jgi:hypothetical protein
MNLSYSFLYGESKGVAKRTNDSGPWKGNLEQMMEGILGAELSIVIRVQ